MSKESYFHVILFFRSNSSHTYKEVSAQNLLLMEQAFASKKDLKFEHKLGISYVAFEHVFEILSVEEEIEEPIKIRSGNKRLVKDL